MWIYNFLDLLVNNFLVLLLTIVGVILGWVGISNLLQKKYGPGGIFTLFSVIALFFSVLLGGKKDNIKGQIKEIDKQIDEKKKELDELQKEVETNKQKQEELKEKEKEVEETLTEKLKDAEEVKPVEVKTDEEISNAFDFASKHK